ncbi:hypothetical protein LMG28614_05466 [Paraburkholderia ultramafica]|uniref:Uncharacterized protein n=1 Tax=Paraburkholderia ultramafica TaxID=1544867 RepID=A0A6S7BX41_9BURK|nr:hypothetical protein [Paraburkholderia ultramafica]CAB3801698.1 hypothetical protein LMG28614_05466 [Paraburkholderia ultramafica]
MWVRAVAAALAMWCVSDAAMAAGYTEVWNPPEASGHAAKPPKNKQGAARVKAGGGLKAGSKVASKAGSKAKAGSKHMASVQHAAPQVASAAGAGHGDKRAAHGSVKKVAAKGTAKSGARLPAAGKPKEKAVVTVQAGKSHAQLAQAKPGQGKVVHANLVQSRTAHPHVVKVAAKNGAAKPAVSHMSAPAMSANVSAGPADAATNPATASSGSLPPIIH